MHGGTKPLHLLNHHHPSKLETFHHCWINVGPASQTVAQHWFNNGSSTHCWNEHTRRWSINVGLLLGQLRRRRTNTYPALVQSTTVWWVRSPVKTTSLGNCKMCAGFRRPSENNMWLVYVEPASDDIIYRASTPRWQIRSYDSINYRVSSPRWQILSYEMIYRVSSASWQIRSYDIIYRVSPPRWQIRSYDIIYRVNSASWQIRSYDIIYRIISPRWQIRSYDIIYRFSPPRWQIRSYGIIYRVNSASWQIRSYDIIYRIISPRWQIRWVISIIALFILCLWLLPLIGPSSMTSLCIYDQCPDPGSCITILGERV